MTLERTTQYPFDLARLVAAHLEKTLGGTPDESVLVRLFEVLYFASLRTDEGRQTLCTVNFVGAESPAGGEPPQAMRQSLDCLSLCQPPAAGHSHGHQAGPGRRSRGRLVERVCR